MAFDCSRDRGFSLLEVLVALVVFGLLTTGVGRLVTVAVRSVTRSRDYTLAVALATERMEQLRGLEWGLREAANPTPRSDVSTDLSVTPAGSGGPGLAAAPLGSLNANHTGYFDFLDVNGLWLSQGPGVPSAPAFVRRWQVRAVPGSPDLLVLQVVVLPLGGRPVSAVPGSDEVWVMTMKGRKAE